MKIRKVRKEDYEQILNLQLELEDEECCYDKNLKKYCYDTEKGRKKLEDRTVGLKETDEELDLNYCKESYNEEIPYALSNSLGFGGHNASILIGKYKEN